MNIIVPPGERSGSVLIPASKSAAHRQLICSALADRKSRLECPGLSADIQATIGCLNALGAHITVSGDYIDVFPIGRPGSCRLMCGESGSTLRFLLPVCGALGAEAVFCMEGLLPSRPHGALTELLNRMGMSIHQEGSLLYCSGSLRSGTYEIPGNISSQFISGLLFALPLLEGDSLLKVTGTIESLPYITMTEQAIAASGITFGKDGSVYTISGGQKYRTGGESRTQRDWSGAAFFLCMGAMSRKGIVLEDMDTDSCQGDRKILDILSAFGARVQVKDRTVRVSRESLRGQLVDAAFVPDLVPAISVLAAGAVGVTRIINAGRLRFKESDRLKTTAAMLKALGGDARETEDGLIITGTGTLKGGTADPAGDHRIAMAAASAAGICTGEITVLNAECAAKSYPAFWEHLDSMEISR